MNVLAQTAFDVTDSGDIQQNTDIKKPLFAQQQYGREIETAASSWFDVTYYRLALRIYPQSFSLQGDVTIRGVCRDSSHTLTLDLVIQMHIDSILLNGKQMSFQQSSDWFIVSLPRVYHAGENLSVDVFYKGFPVTGGLGSFAFTSHEGVPWVHTLSEPYGAKDWWPCKNDPGDKADSADVIITCDSTFRAGSQGILVSAINNGNGTTTYYWKERYPIASYLISIALTNYIQFSNWFRYTAKDSMEILNYILPEHEATARQTLPQVVNMLSIYSNLFGLYPFIKEKYGHAEISGGSAMEHQTMTSLNTFSEDVISHELAHQWFGDMITCRTWSDLWLNEGFAQYCSALYRERQYGAASYWTYINTQINSAKVAFGAIGIADTSSVRSLFNGPRVYAKGAVVLHMLRHVLGDSVFFRTMYAYANDPRYKYGTAAIKDFQSVAESVSGKNLSYFFQEWLYGDKYPNYNYSWTWKPSGDSSMIILTINQTMNGTSPSFYTMPIDIRITTANRDTTFVVLNNAQQQTFILKCSEKPSAVSLDPDGWILKYSASMSDQPPTTYALDQNYPNPFNAATTISYHLPSREQVLLTVYDLLGHEVATLVNEKQSAGTYEYQWNPQNMASGIYIYRLLAGTIQMERKMVLIK
jgi:aminopeptidase N